MKKYFIISIILIAVLGFLIGIYMYKTNKLDNVKIANSNFSVVTDECTEIAELYELGMINIKKTNASEEVISPNANITFKIYYRECEHLITKKENDIKDLINLSKEELQEKYIDWEIEKFSLDDIVLYKEVDDFCDEHYILKEENGYIVIYRLDKENHEKLLEITSIAVDYLENEDLKKIENGIKINTKTELNKLLEDYE